MKIRSGFVSNSSTSSFICEISHAIGVAGHSSSYYEDVNPTSCVNGHDFEHSYLLKDIEVNKVEDKLEDLLFFENLVDSEDLAIYLKDKKDESAINSLYEKYKSDINEKYDNAECGYGNYMHDVPEHRCPICQFQDVKLRSVINFLLIEKYGKSDITKAKDEIIKRFGNLKSFEEYLKEGK